MTIKMTSADIRRTFLSFFEKRGHAIIPSASLVPQNDPSVLFNTAGMQPLVPYLLGQKHPLGTRLANFQKCVRTGDMDDIGDNTHATFFEMMGNWSLGDYFKEEAISWSYELLTSKTEGFGLDPARLYVTVFEGDENAPRDTEAAAIWKKFIPEHRIYYRPAKSNWWSPGDNGPCGPDSEMFYDVTPEGLGDMTLEQYLKADDEQKVVEIWNDVFMEYEKKDGAVIGKLSSKNVDTGSGFERVTMVLQGKTNIYETDIFAPIIGKINEFTIVDELKSKRIIADHIRASVFLIGDGVLPSNKDQGYVLRRLLRRAIRHSDILKMKHSSLFWIADIVIESYKDSYQNLFEQKEYIKKVIDDEEQKFRKTLESGIKEIYEKMLHVGVSATDAFDLYQSKGIPLDVTLETAERFRNEINKGLPADHQRGFEFNHAEFNELVKKQQDLSRSGAEQKFKGGLAGTGAMEIRYHTATHLLNAALREVLGDHVAQKGSNITAERMRFDFVHPTKMTDEEKKRVEDIINSHIAAALPVTFVELPLDQALKTGAQHMFGEKYGDIVKVYSIGIEKGDGKGPQGYVSREFCGGPHVSNTKELAGDTNARFKIVKEEAVSAGVRRIKAVLE